MRKALKVSLSAASRAQLNIYRFKIAGRQLFFRERIRPEKRSARRLPSSSS
jgi:hypothetical protein